MTRLFQTISLALFCTSSFAAVTLPEESGWIARITEVRNVVAVPERNLVNATIVLSEQVPNDYTETFLTLNRETVRKLSLSPIGNSGGMSNRFDIQWSTTLINITAENAQSLVGKVLQLASLRYEVRVTSVTDVQVVNTSTHQYTNAILNFNRPIPYTDSTIVLVINGEARRFTLNRASHSITEGSPSRKIAIQFPNTYRAADFENKEVRIYAPELPKT